MTEQAYKNILVRQEGRVGIAQLHRPEARNALNREAMEEVIAALEEFEANATVGCMIVAGSEKVFAAGADIKQMATAPSSTC